ncbi:hypothetical protein [Pseudomonas sp. TMP9]|uniref:hypothetical protein n=1 Tax=unclassified Pseudomonas TaxID=196821 RepID=UPI0030D572B0
MNTPAITIEALLQRDQLHWQVRMGRRCLTFNDEKTARAFAAQLHMRLLWLQHSSHPQDRAAPPDNAH